MGYLSRDFSQRHPTGRMIEGLFHSSSSLSSNEIVHIAYNYEEVNNDTLNTTYWTMREEEESGPPTMINLFGLNDDDILRAIRKDDVHILVVCASAVTLKQNITLVHGVSFASASSIVCLFAALNTTTTHIFACFLFYVQVCVYISSFI